MNIRNQDSYFISYLKVVLLEKKSFKTPKPKDTSAAPMQGEKSVLLRALLKEPVFSYQLLAQQRAGLLFLLPPSSPLGIIKHTG